MLVEIRYIEQEEWHGKKGAELNFVAPVVIAAQFDPEKFQYKVDLPEKVLKEYKIDLAWRDGEIHPYFDQQIGRVKLPYHTFFLDTDKREDNLHYGIIRGHPLIANSREEYDKGLWPQARWVIYNEEAELAAKAAKIDVVNKARAMSFKMDPEQKVKVLMMWKGKNYRSASPNHLSVAIDQMITEDVDKFLSYAEMEREVFEVKALVEECMLSGVLKEENASIYFGEQRIAFTKEEAYEFLSNPANSEFLGMLKSRIKGKK